MSSDAVKTSGERQEIFVNSRREAVIIFVVWAACFAWAVPYCYINGYDNPDPKLFLGVPSWIFWGIAFPWLLADIFTTWFCFWYMKDDDLNEAVPDQEEGGAV